MMKFSYSNNLYPIITKLCDCRNVFWHNISDKFVNYGLCMHSGVMPPLIGDFFPKLLCLLKESLPYHHNLITMSTGNINWFCLQKMSYFIKGHLCDSLASLNFCLGSLYLGHHIKSDIFTCNWWGLHALTSALTNTLVWWKWTFSSIRPCTISKRFSLYNILDYINF